MENMDIIKPINKDTVHRICSGQVVLNLAIAVKELIENSIDAGAKTVEVRLKNYGMDSVEVSDNGSGIRSENFAALTLKHYTSKIREFDDLESVCTLGFRGEALSSLCALSDVSVITRHLSAEHGIKLQYDHNGDIIDEKPIARPVGTTVTLSNLFTSLPVRRIEFVKNHKKEFNKMCNLLYAYCLVSKNVKFSCTNQTKSKSSLIITTNGANSIKDNIISVFGSKQVSTLIEVELTEPDEAVMQEYDLKCVGAASPFKFEFFISSVTHGNGRNSSDRQFYFINSRPCEPTKLMKLTNEIYRQFNNSQYPFVYLNILVEGGFVDVNVTPDKRQIFLEKEKFLLATVKASLLESFKNFPSTYKMQNTTINESIRGQKRNLDEPESGKTFLDAFRKKPKQDNEETLKMPKIPMIDRKNQKTSLFDIPNFTITHETKENYDDKITSNANESQSEMCDDKIVMTEELTSCKLNLVKTARKMLTKSNKGKPTQQDVEEIKTGIYRKNRNKINLQITIDDIAHSLQKQKINVDSEQLKIKFCSKISPESNERAEKELQKQITKDKFRRMEIVGQFNYAFIVASLENDLFIIDQHASDEKYNYEVLRKTTVMESQTLVIPKDLQLTSASESILIENEEVFKKNGFHFNIDDEAEATKKVKLIKIPLSKNYIFGKDDIDEMLYMLQEGCENCRPTRINGMFASRACRKSVMVGRPLNKIDMRRLIDHMGEIDQPWNCPHGRPTMRHLVNLDLLSS